MTDQNKTITSELSARTTLWKFLNSNFGLFVLSSVLLGFISWAYGETQAQRKATAERRVQSERLEAELKYRRILMDYYFDHVKSIQSNEMWRPVAHMHAIFNGGTSQSYLENISMTYAPVFDEYKDRTLPSIYWQYRHSQEKIDHDTINVNMMGMIEFGVSIDELIDAHDNDTIMITMEQLKQLNRSYSRIRAAMY